MRVLGCWIGIGWIGIGLSIYRFYPSASFGGGVILLSATYCLNRAYSASILLTQPPRSANFVESYTRPYITHKPTHPHTHIYSDRVTRAKWQWRRQWLRRWQWQWQWRWWERTFGLTKRYFPSISVDLLAIPKPAIIIASSHIVISSHYIGHTSGLLRISRKSYLPNVD